MYFKDFVEICIEGEPAERFLNMCSFHDIKLFNLQNTEDNKYHACIHAKDFFSLKNIIKKSNIKVKIIQKKGFSFRIKKIIKRKAFFVTPFLCLLILWMNSNLLWGIHIEGNSAVTKDLIEDFLHEEGIHYGMPLSKIPIYELKTNLRTRYDEITWVSIYLMGTNLQISLKERDTIHSLAPTNSCGENLIAPVDGIVDSVLVRQGTSLVSPGMDVKKGDILIEGKINIPDQDGNIKETRYCKANGDVYLVYPYNFEQIISLNHVTKQYTGKTYKKYIFLFKDKLLEFPFFKVPFLNYDCVTVPLEDTLLHMFSIPLEIHQATYRDYVLVREKYTVEEAKAIANEFLNKIIVRLDEKGVQIIKKNVKIRTDSVSLYLTGELTLKECCNTFELLEESQ